MAELIRGLRIAGGLEGRSLSAGQYQGRLGRQLGGVCSPRRSLGAVAVDLNALRARGESYYQQGVALYNQGDAWLATAMNEFAKLDNFDPSQIDWNNLAANSTDTAIDFLASQLKIKSSGGQIQLPNAPGVMSYGDFLQVLSDTQQNMGPTQEQKAQAALLAILQRQKQQKQTTLDTQQASTPVYQQPVIRAMPYTGDRDRNRILAVLAAVGAVAGTYLFLWGK